jgi:hypothetical protein
MPRLKAFSSPTIGKMWYLWAIAIPVIAVIWMALSALKRARRAKDWGMRNYVRRHYD